MMDLLGLNLSYVSAILILFSIVYITVKTTQRNQLHLSFIVTLWLIFFWNICVILMFYFPNHFQLLRNISFIGACLAPVTFLLTGYTFAKYRVKNKKYIVLLFVIPFISLIIIWTNSFHHLFWITDSFENDKIVLGKYFIIHLVYSYTCIIISFCYLVYFSIKNSGFFSKQAILITVGTSIPVIMDLLLTLKIIKAAIYVDNISFSASMLFYFYAIIKHDFLNITPIALRQVVDHISDSFLVIDERNLLIDYNKTLVDTFPDVFTLQRKINIISQLEKINIGQEQVIRMIQQAVLHNTTASFEQNVFIRDTKLTFIVEITPIMITERHVGTIILFKNITEQRKYIETLEEKNLQLDEANAELIAQNDEIESLNKKLKEMADIDGLTGAYNRRFFNEYYEIEINRVLNQIEHNSTGNVNMSFGVIIIDIDDFKKINDTYGHLTGDSVLKQVVTLIKKVTFTRDIVCRYGGEEFAVIFTETDKEGALKATYKILNEIQNHQFVFNQEVTDGHVTVSIGFAFFDGSPDLINKNLLKIADDRLYQAKKSGKNRVIWE